MSRESLLESLSNYSTEYPAEKERCDRFMDFVEQNPQCFSRSLTIGHVTASCWLLSLDRKKVLLTQHKKLNKWLQLGGHCDGESNTALAAIKEAKEESGIEKIALIKPDFFDIDIHSIPERKGEPAHFHYDLRYVLGVQNSNEYSLSDESHSLQWVAFEELENYTQEESVLRLNRKWMVLSPH